MERDRIERARAFLALPRLALVGVSRRQQDLSRLILRELLQRGCDVVPVSLSLGEVEGRACVKRVQDIRPPVDGALLLTPPAQTTQVVQDCLAAGIRRVWMHRGAGHGAASPEALDFCAANGMEVVTDLCPFMAWQGAGFPHRVHGFLRRALA